MARSTKKPAAGAASKSTAGARSEKDGTTRDDAASPDTVEDAVVVSEETGGDGSRGETDPVSTGSPAPDTDPAPGSDEATADRKSADEASIDGSSTPSGPVGAGEDTDAEVPAAKAPVTAGGIPKVESRGGRGTIGPGSDAPGPDPRLAGPGPDMAARGSSDEVPDGAPASADARSAEAPKDPAPAPAGRRSTGFVPLLLGGLLAGAIGYAIPTYVTSGDDPAVGALETDLAALTAARASDDAAVEGIRAAQADLVDRVGMLSDRVAALETAAGMAGAATTEEADTVVAEGAADEVPAAPSPDGPAAGASTAGLSGSDAAAPSLVSETELSVLAARLDDVASRGAGTAGDLSALDARVGEIVDRLDASDGTAEEVGDRVEAVSNDVAALREDLGARVGAVEDGLEQATERASTVEDEAQTLARTAARNQIIAALASGAPFAEPLAVMGSEAPPALMQPAETGVTTRTELLAQFPPLAREALRVSRAAGSEAGVGSLMRSAFGARSLAPREGDDPDAVLSRAEAAARAGDLRTALTEIDMLPEAGRDAFATWSEAARTRLDAVDAAEEFLKDG